MILRRRGAQCKCGKASGERQRGPAEQTRSRRSAVLSSFELSSDPRMGRPMRGLLAESKFPPSVMIDCSLCLRVTRPRDGERDRAQASDRYRSLDGELTGGVGVHCLCLHFLLIRGHSEIVLGAAYERREGEKRTWRLGNPAAAGKPVHSGMIFWYLLCWRRRGPGDCGCAEFVGGARAESQKTDTIRRAHFQAPLAQLDRASVYGTEGYRFESCGVY